MARIRISARNGLTSKKPQSKLLLILGVVNLVLSVVITLRLFGII